MKTTQSTETEVNKIVTELISENLLPEIPEHCQWCDGQCNEKPTIYRRNSGWISEGCFELWDEVERLIEEDK